MEDNYLTRSKIHTKALVVTMDMMLKNRKANLMNYHGIFHHWYEWIHINAQFYENLTYPTYQKPWSEIQGFRCSKWQGSPETVRRYYHRYHPE